jgi:hypothetical protein
MADFTKHGIAVPPLAQPHWMGRGFVAEPDLTGVVQALVQVHAGLPEGSAAAAQRWIENEMCAAAVGGHFDALIQDGMREAPPRPVLSGAEAGPRPSRTSTPPPQPKRSSAKKAPSRPRGHGGDNGAATVLRYEEWSLSAWVEPASAFVLLMSSKFVLVRGELNKALTRPMWQDAPENGAATELAFLLSQRADGTRFPSSQDASRGRIERDATILVRTGVLARAVRAAQATGAVETELFDVLLQALKSGQVTGMIHDNDHVVAREAASGDKSEL